MRGRVLFWSGHIRRLGLFATVVLLAAGCSTPAATEPPVRVLVFSATAGFRHASIETGVRAIEDLGQRDDLVVSATERASDLGGTALDEIDVLVFLNTTGDVLEETIEAAVERFVRQGGGFVGIHAATDTEYEWDWYGRLLGARFAGHPAVQPADVVVVDREHPSTMHLPGRWRRTDEWYDFDHAPSDPGIRILALLDESTYEGGSMGDRHPFSWCGEFDGGRVWYTAGGHTHESYSEEAFMRHVLGGIQWAAGPPQQALGELPP